MQSYSQSVTKQQGQLYRISPGTKVIVKFFAITHENMKSSTAPEAIALMCNGANM